MPKIALLLLSFLFITACSSDPDPDTGTQLDAGSKQDAQTSQDIGTQDTGGASDASVQDGTTLDTGTEADAGTVDTGAPKCIVADPVLLEGSSIGHESSMALDSNGNVHVAYYDDSNERISYANNVGGNWTIEPLATRGIVGPDLSFALDSAGNVHISYHDFADQDLIYLTNVSGSWAVETVDATGDVGSNSSLGIDSNNFVHIAYADSDGRDTKYATNASGAWVSVTVDADGVTDGMISLAVAGNDTVHISYFESLDDDLRYATNASGSWVTADVETNNDVGRHNQIAVDSLGAAHIAYVDQTDDEVKYATNATGSWHIDRVSMFAMGWAAIAVGDNDVVHVVYRRDNWDVVYGNSVDGWQTATIDQDDESHSMPSLALDAQLKVHFTYMRSSDNFTYVSNATGAWEMHPLDQQGNAGMDGDIALAGDGSLHVAFTEVWWTDELHRALKYGVLSAAGVWTSTTVDGSATEIGGHASLELDAQGAAHISYYNADEKDLKYATNASGSWMTQTLDPGGLRGSFSDLALDSNGHVHISYFNEDNTSLMYATNSTGSWSLRELDADGGVGQHTSIHLDDNDVVHIAYYDHTDRALMYATNGTGSWVYDAIEDGTTRSGHNTDIFVDQNGALHISYNDDTLSESKYATNASGGWSTQSLFRYGHWVLRRRTTVAVDAGKVYYLVNGGDFDNLRLTIKEGSQWLTTIVSDHADGNATFQLDGTTAHVLFRAKNGVWYAPVDCSN